MLRSNQERKIAVLGAGAIGSLIGGLLARTGEDVTLVGRRAHVEAIRAGGLRIEGVLGALTIPVKAAEVLDFTPDLVLLAAKTQDVEGICDQARSYIQSSVVVTLQNGVRSDEMVAARVPRENIVSGVVMLNAQFLDPGRVTYAHAGSLLIGAPFGENGQLVQEIRALLGQAVAAEVSDNIQGAHWTKLLLNNLGNGLEAMTGMPLGECMRHASLSRIGVLALKEGHRVITGAGFRLAPIPRVPAPALEFMIRSPVLVSARALSLSMGSMKTLSSTLQSLRRGRPTEIDYLNGEIVRLGQRVGVATPYNSTVVEIVKEVEKTGQFLSIGELVKRFP